MAKTDKTPKVPNPKAYVDADLVGLTNGLEWDTVEIQGIDFALVVPVNYDGIQVQTKGNEVKATQMYTRALRIDAPAKLDARDRIKLARKNGTLDKVVAAIQGELYTFDVTTIPTRAPRTPKTVTAPDKANYTKAEVDAMCAAQGIKFVTTAK